MILRKKNRNNSEALHVTTAPSSKVGEIELVGLGTPHGALLTIHPHRGATSGTQAKFHCSRVTGPDWHVA